MAQLEDPRTPSYCCWATMGFGQSVWPRVSHHFSFWNRSILALCTV